MLIEQIEVGVFAENCYIVGCEESMKGVVIDPGDEIPLIVDRIKQSKLNIEKVLLTHGHLDHVKEVNAFVREFNVPVVMHKQDQFLLDSLPTQAAAFGMTTSGIPQIDHYIEEGDSIEFGKIRFEIIHTPGHSPGSVSFLSDNNIFSGDVLFAGSIGRTDLPGGDFHTLIETIRSKLFPLGDGSNVYPGHGPVTTIGQERKSNPFLLAD